MTNLLSRAVFAFLILPGIVAFIVPLWLAPGRDSFQPLGLILLVPGVTGLLWCVREFYVRGEGTLGPWKPPVRLVVSGLYRFTRNPMYVCVQLILWGWALAFHSRGLAAYALIVLVVFHARVVLFEEPWAAQTFGDDWTAYKVRVPRWFWRVR